MYALVLLLGAGPPPMDAESRYQRLEKAFWKATGRTLDGEVVEAWAPAFFAHAERFPEDASAVRALIRLASLTYATNFKGDTHRKAQRALEERYLRGEAVVGALRNLGLSNGEVESAFLRRVAESHSDRRVRALAWRAVVNGRGGYLEMRKESIAAGSLKTLPADVVNQMKAEMAKWAKEIAEARAKLKSPELAGAIPDVSVGAKAPPTEGVDLTGKKVSLADHKGKVVVLDFWFVKCGPCRQMMPATNALVTEMKGRPFAAVSVNTDRDAGEALAFQKKTTMLGHHWWAGHGSPVLEAWDVEAYPTLYVIDHEGIIRHHQVGYDAKTDRVADIVRELMKRAEK